MTRLIRTELLKQRTTGTFVIGVAAAPVIAVLVTVAVYGAARTEGNDPLGPASFVQAIGAPAGVVTVVALLLGVLGMAGEYRHETITTTFLATPRRRDVVLAKLAAHTITGALIGVLTLVAALAVAVPWLRADGVAVHVDADALRVASGLVASTALYGALGVSIGALIRNQTAACALVLAWLLAVEELIGDVFSGSAFVHWLPAAAGRALVDAGTGGDALPAPVAAAVFGAYVAALAIAATRLTLVRDVT